MIPSFYFWLNFFKGWNFWKTFSNNISTSQNKINLTFLLNVLVLGNHFGSLTHNLLNAIIHVCDWLLINSYSTFKKKTQFERGLIFKPCFKASQLSKWKSTLKCWDSLFYILSQCLILKTFSYLVFIIMLYFGCEPKAKITSIYLCNHIFGWNMLC
jgi:hypothetical protein